MYEDALRMNLLMPLAFLLLLGLCSYIGLSDPFRKADERERDKLLLILSVSGGAGYMIFVVYISFLDGLAKQLY